MKKFLLAAFFVTVFAIGFTAYLEYQASSGRGSNLTPQTFELVSGVGVLELGGQLEDKGIISSQYAFAWEVATKKLSRKLIAGEYELSGDQSIQSILVDFTSGKVAAHDVKVTFPEGWTARLMAERLNKNNLPGDAFLAEAMKPGLVWRDKYPFLKSLPVGASLEGFLFPDTYRFAPDVAANDIIDTMLSTFNKRFGEELRTGPMSQKHSLFDIVTLASIVEEEGRLEKDRQIIADIFWKRLASGQAFQSDATVNYVLGTLKEQPTLKDIDVDSPYNTYKYPGLPPGPISNPSLMSLKAAVSPTPNPYYYFLNNLDTKEMYYAKTFEEHVENRRIHGL